MCGHFFVLGFFFTTSKIIEIADCRWQGARLIVLAEPKTATSASARLEIS